MEHKARNGVAALTAVAAMTAGYLRGEQINTSSTAADIAAAESNLELADMQYQVLGGVATCETTVLHGTRLEHVDDNSLSTNRTKKLLDGVCGPDVSHADLAKQATVAFRHIGDVKVDLDKVRNKASYDLSEKITLPMSAAAVDLVLVCLGFAAKDVMKKRKQYRKMVAITKL